MYLTLSCRYILSGEKQCRLPRKGCARKAGVTQSGAVGGWRTWEQRLWVVRRSAADWDGGLLVRAGAAAPPAALLVRGLRPITLTTQHQPLRIGFLNSTPFVFLCQELNLCDFGSTTLAEPLRAGGSNIVLQNWNKTPTLLLIFISIALERCSWCHSGIG